MKIIYLSILMVLPACSHMESKVHARSTADSFKISDVSRYFADEQGPTTEQFNNSIASALSGNESELAYILSLARFSDGEGSLSYGNFLYDLKTFLGAGKFDKSLKSLPEEQQRSVQIDMRSAEEMRRSMKANT